MTRKRKNGFEKVERSYKILQCNKCIEPNCDNVSCSVHGKNPYCREHVEEKCCLSGETNIFNEKRCNATIEMITCGGKMYCNGHYRTLISTCAHKDCQMKRSSNNLCYDKRWYCVKHQLKQSYFNKYMIERVFSSLDIDVVNKICDIHQKNDSYKI
jgi:hypothetical protein